MSKKNFMTEENCSQFKIPLPKKRSAFQNVGSNSQNSNFILNNKSTSVEMRHKLKLMKLLFKLAEKPESLTKGDKITLTSHPIISD
mmetsp:Transcript_27361/g.24240  ORF Transcript_27361/g.24240 Transcript_27361/m.24240 type:complete len:86 (-) Transcript_27361:641-898(-)